MSRPAPPLLTVRSDWSRRSFASGHDVFVGSDFRADMHVAHPLIAPAHLLLRFDQGRWVAIDNGSSTGMFVNGRRMQVVDINNGQSINLGGPDGPRLIFEVGYHQGVVGRPPPGDWSQVTTSMRTTLQSGPQPAQGPGVTRPYIPRPASAPPGPPPAARQAPPPPQPPNPPYPASGPHHLPEHPTQVVRSRPTHPGPPPISQRPTQMARLAAEVSGLAATVLRGPRPTSKPRLEVAGSATIGRALDNDIVLTDVLASRYHAYLTPTPLGTEIRDTHSINGTFVNGTRVGSAVLGEGDVVTIGNIDLLFTDGILVRPAETPAQTGGLEVRQVDFIVDGKTLLENVSLTARPGTLTAVIGGSGAGKSTLARLIAGYTRPSSGVVTFQGHDLHAEYASLRSRIGMVPQDDVVHHQLTVNQALGYAAELRLPPDTSKEDRARVVTQIIEELELGKHVDTRVDKLSGGQRKRASVAMELLTGPSLLILDEPTSGLDPALDLQVMTMLRHLADAGRVVLVVTHSLTYLDVCDQVLLMAPGGKTAFLGPPDQIGAAMGTTNWAHIFAKVGADPDEANRRFLAQARPPLPVPEADQPADLGAPAHTSVLRQFSTIARRQIRVIVSDRTYFIFLALLPFVMGALALTVPGHAGLGIADARSDAPDEAGGILTLLTMAAIFIGTALTIRDLIGERPIFRREQAVGLSTTAYLGAKIAVFSMFAIVQSAIATTMAILGKGAPTRPAVLLGNATFELYVTVAAACVASAMFGLMLSSLVRSNEQVTPLLVVSLMAQFVLCGGMGPVTNRVGLDQMSWAVPARWGFAASASTVDLSTLEPGPIRPKDSHWKHTSGAWLFDMGMLAALSLVYTGIVWWRTRLKRH